MRTLIKFKIPVEIYIIIIISTIALIAINYYQLDFYFANLIYEPTGSWFYKSSWLTNLVIHQLGKYTLILLYLYLIYKFFSRDRNLENSYERYGKIILLISILIGTMLVSLLKQLLSVDCPWSLLQFGGDKPFLSLFSYDSKYLPSEHCFPSAHASTAFTWISLYFYVTIFHPIIRHKILIALLIIGFTFGLSQQFRGAHFISHDIWSLLVCIFVNIVIFKIAFRKSVHPD